MKDIAKFIALGGIFLVPFITLIISNNLFFPFITGKNFTFRVIVEIVFAAWVILALYEPVYRPRFSWILGSFTALVVIMFVADWFGANRTMSFWSNFERMEGYVTLIHTYLYLIVLGSVLTTDKLWNRFFNTVFASSLFLTLYAFLQLSGDITINQGGWRLDGTLGNSAYMAIYMLFNIFLALLMLVRSTSRGGRIWYGLLALLFVYLLIQTATRGTILGFALGLCVATAYIALFSRAYPRVRKIAAGSLIMVVLIVGLFIKFRTAPIIQNNPYLGRVANISLSEGSVRFTVWRMAYEGFKERPILGWGQSNFNYVFNKNYDPSIYYAEAWYDRVHDIFFDWLIAGGALGTIAYFAIYLSALYYLFLRPLIRHEEVFSVTERGVLIGLLVGYLFHNIFVFDNIVSYIYYGTILAFIHARIGVPMPRIATRRVDTRIIEQIAAPVMGVALFVALYFVNLPGILAAGDIIDAFRETDPDAMLVQFNEALDRNSFGNQEIREQMTRRVQDMMNTEGISEEKKQKLAARVEEELAKQVAENPNDARAHLFLSSFYRMAGMLDKALLELEIARSLSPRKQQIIIEQGLATFQKNEFEKAHSFFKEAYELEPKNNEARDFYAMTAVAIGDMKLAETLIPDEKEYSAFLNKDNTLLAAVQGKQYAFATEQLKKRIEADPKNSQFRTSLAYVLNESGDMAGALQVLKKAGEDIPEFKKQSEDFINYLLSTKKATPGG